VELEGMQLIYSSGYWVFICLWWFSVFHSNANHEYEMKFEQKFQDTCQKYDFVRTYSNIMKELPERYLIFVFHEENHSTGGLGDRFAGLITAMAYSIRFNRILLIKGDSAFEKAFKPYHFANETDERFSWGSWSWSNWKDDYLKEMEEFPCVNPNRFSQGKCAFDSDHPVKVMKMYSNRVYLCRWVAVESLNLRAELEKTLQNNIKTQLYETAGGVLRLSLSTTKVLWKSFISSRENSFLHKDQLHHHNSQHSSVALPQHHSSRPESLQIGIHFRCGDSTMEGKEDQPPNPQCLEISGVEWKGTSFYDDYSLDSPVHLGKCAQQKIDEKRNKSVQSIESNNNNNHSSNNSLTNAIVFITSDHRRSSKQILEYLSPEVPVYMPTNTACNVDHKKTSDCTLSTLEEWFLLSFSDLIITQELKRVDPKSAYCDTNVMDYLQAPYPPEYGAISAFSKYALVYGLNFDQLYHGKCVAANTTTIGHYSHGNWMCFTKVFY
jgi:hypothetical protein